VFTTYVSNGNSTSANSSMIDHGMWESRLALHHWPVVWGDHGNLL